MSRGTTPAILALLQQRTRDKLRCVIKLRHHIDWTPGSRTQPAVTPPLS